MAVVLCCVVAAGLQPGAARQRSTHRAAPRGGRSRHAPAAPLQVPAGIEVAVLSAAMDTI